MSLLYLVLPAPSYIEAMIEVIQVSFFYSIPPYSFVILWNIFPPKFLAAQKAVVSLTAEGRNGDMVYIDVRADPEMFRKMEVRKIIYLRLSQC